MDSAQFSERLSSGVWSSAISEKQKVIPQWKMPVGR